MTTLEARPNPIFWQAMSRHLATFNRYVLLVWIDKMVDINGRLVHKRGWWDTCSFSNLEEALPALTEGVAIRDVLTGQMVVGKVN